MLFKLFGNQVSMCNFNFFFLSVSFKKKKSISLFTIFLLRHYNIIRLLIFYNSTWLNLTKISPSYNLQGCWYDPLWPFTTSCKQEQNFSVSKIPFSTEILKGCFSQQTIEYKQISEGKYHYRMYPCLTTDLELNFPECKAKYMEYLNIII